MFELDEEEKFKKLLHREKVIRDSVHGDIWITPLEKEIIDWEQFQRLRRIKQLGPTNFVYPSANHTRFEHSIGTLFMAQQIIDAINRNYENQLSLMPIGAKDTFITRVVALIHDMAHIAFGHTLEEEGRIFKKKQWLDDERLTKIFYGKFLFSTDKKFKKELTEGNLSEELKAVFQANGYPLPEETIVTPGIRNNHGWEIQDKDKEKVYYINEVGKKLNIYDHENTISIIIKRHLEKELRRDKVQAILNEIKDLLIAEEKGDEAIRYQDHPYIADIVGNTICADLLDYIKRDAYNTGLQMEYDPRILSYFILDDYTFKDPEGKKITKPRLILLLKRKEKERRDIISSAIDLLRMRYSLAEKVYYHHAKISASAMVIKAIYCALQGAIINKNDLMSLGDEALLYYIASYKSENDKSYEAKAVKHIANALLSRKLYKDIYSLQSYTDENKRQVEACTDPQYRLELEKEIERTLKLPPGSIIIYAPKEDKGKEAKTKVKLHGEPLTLEELGGERDYKLTIGKELEVLEEKYLSLWKFSVFLDRRFAEDSAIKDKLLMILDDLFKRTSNRPPVSLVRLRAQILTEQTGYRFSDEEIDDVARAAIRVETDPRELFRKIDDLLRTRIRKNARKQ